MEVVVETRLNVSCTWPCTAVVSRQSLSRAERHKPTSFRWQALDLAYTVGDTDLSQHVSLGVSALSRAKAASITRPGATYLLTQPFFSGG